MADKKVNLRSEATRRWEQKNPEKTKRDRYKRNARLFVRTYATDEDIAELMETYKNKEK